MRTCLPGWHSRHVFASLVHVDFLQQRRGCVVGCDDDIPLSMTPGTLDVANRLLWQAGRARETQRARAREGERMAEGEGRTDGRRAGWKREGGRETCNLFLYAYVCVRICTCVCVYVCLCLCLCLCTCTLSSHTETCERGGEKRSEGGRDSTRVTRSPPRSSPRTCSLTRVCSLTLTCSDEVLCFIDKPKVWAL